MHLVLRMFYQSLAAISGCSLLAYDARSFASQDLVIFFPLKLCQFGWEKVVNRHFQVSPQASVGFSQGKLQAFKMLLNNDEVL